MKSIITLLALSLMSLSVACSDKADAPKVAPKVLADESPVTDKNVENVAAALEAELDKELAE